MVDIIIKILFPLNMLKATPSFFAYINEIKLGIKTNPFITLLNKYFIIWSITRVNDAIKVPVHKSLLIK